MRHTSRNADGLNTHTPKYAGRGHSLGLVVNLQIGFGSRQQIQRSKLFKVVWVSSIAMKCTVENS